MTNYAGNQFQVKPYQAVNETPTNMPKTLHFHYGKIMVNSLCMSFWLGKLKLKCITLHGYKRVYPIPLLAEPHPDLMVVFAAQTRFLQNDAHSRSPFKIT